MFRKISDSLRAELNCLPAQTQGVFKIMNMRASDLILVTRKRKSAFADIQKLFERGFSFRANANNRS
ncbi:MAG: hypothetical protein CMJ77_02650 [Planctomycetaceae bacterium]|nr:hypothetical protein [Planctomycetaceae bacterium]